MSIRQNLDVYQNVPYLDRQTDFVWHSPVLIYEVI